MTTAMLLTRIGFTNAPQRKQALSLIRQTVTNLSTMSTPPPPAATTASSTSVTSRSCKKNHLSDNFQLITTDADVLLDRDAATVRVALPREKPLVLLFAWMLPQERHLRKFTELYTEQGFDVLIAKLSPWQVLWPAKGSQVVAGEILDFLHANPSYTSLFVHGFSVGGYLWGEVLVKLHEQPELHRPIVDRFVGQVWDSVADIVQMQAGFPHAVFPNSKFMQMATNKYISCHLWVFHNAATCHYLRASELFHDSLVKAPALFLLSKIDPIGSEKSIRHAHDLWAANGIQTYWKCWDNSPHVGHFRMYPEEYTGELFSFLKTLNLVPYPEKIPSKL